MNCEEYDFRNKRGQTIFCRFWSPKSDDGSSNIKAIAFLVHGLAEHCGRYTSMVTRLVDAGIAVISQDHHGHGRSEGQRIYVEDYEDYVNDIQEHVELARDERIKGRPVFLVGHSMGGLISIMTVMKYPKLFKGIILDAPALELPIGSLKMFVLKMISYVYPSFVVGKLQPSQLCQDKAVVEDYINDPLNYLVGVDVNWLVKSNDAIQKILASTEKLRDIPILNFHGDGDSVTYISGSERFHSLLPPGDHELKVIKGAYHQIHNEPEGVGNKFNQDLIDWITKHLV